MKVVFLDFDGVLNNFKERNFGTEFSKQSCGNFNSLQHKVPGLKIVISSAWRSHGLEYCKRVLETNHIDSTHVIDVTGNENGNRGYQIKCWLDRHPEVNAYVIIDDDSDMGDLLHKLVKTNSFIGLTQKEVALAVKVLKQPK